MATARAPSILHRESIGRALMIVPSFGPVNWPLSCTLSCLLRDAAHSTHEEGKENEITKYFVAAGRVFLVCGTARGRKRGPDHQKHLTPSTRAGTRRHAQALASRVLRGAKVAASQEAALKRAS